MTRDCAADFVGIYLYSTCRGPGGPYPPGSPSVPKFESVSPGLLNIKKRIACDEVRRGRDDLQCLAGTSVGVWQPAGISSFAGGTSLKAIDPEARYECSEALKGHLWGGLFRYPRSPDVPALDNPLASRPGSRMYLGFRV